MFLSQSNLLNSKNDKILGLQKVDGSLHFWLVDGWVDGNQSWFKGLLSTILQHKYLVGFQG